MTTQLHNISVPALGELWPEQGGHFAGIFNAADGSLYALIVPPKDVGELGQFQWGKYGQDVQGANSLTDGQLNTQAMLANKNSAAHCLAGFEHQEFKDWYLPSKGELASAHMHCQNTFKPDEYYWSSTQYSAYNAWYEGFDYGNTDIYGKNYTLRVLPVRRFKL